jgi:hypothetical protein
MPIPNVSQVSGSNPRNSSTYPLIVLSVLAGGFLFIHRQFNYTLPEAPALVVLVGLVLGVPAVMGYTGYSFVESTVTGMLPWLGLRVGVWVDPPFTLYTIENMVESFILSAGTVLPVVAVSFIIGIGLRDRDALRSQARPLAIRLAASFLLALVLVAATEMGFLSVDQVQ